VSFAVADGEVVSLIGPSGCGKSTLLNIGSGLTAPSEGEAYVDGQRVEGPNAHVAFMLQKDLLLPWRTVVENVMFGVEIQGVPLAERRRRLLAIDWVQDASVSRVWPNRLLVRIRERKPVAFVSFSSGPMLVDAEGALLALPPRARFAFPVIDGLREGDSGAQRREGVSAFLRFQQDMGYLANDVSEVDVADPADIRIVARVENRAVELFVGDGDFAARYQNFLSHYQEIRRESPDAGTFDLRLDDRITARK